MNRFGIFSAIMLAGLVSLSSGCTTWNGKRAGEAQVVRIGLEAKNFKILRSSIQGQASCQYLFPGFVPLIAKVGGLLGGGAAQGAQIAQQTAVAGGIALGQPDLYNRAYAELRKKAELVGKSAHIFNVIQEDVLTNYIVVGDEKLIITADVILFTDPYIDYKHAQ